MEVSFKPGPYTVPVGPDRYRLEPSKAFALERDAEQGALAFLASHTDFPPPTLEYGRWINVGPKHKRAEQGAPRYIAHKGTGDDGRTFVTVTFSTFKGGGYTLTWKSWEAGVVPNYRPKFSPKPAKTSTAPNAEAISTLRKQARVIAAYDQAGTTGASPYLERKQVADHAGAVHGARYGTDGTFYYPLQDADGTEHALKVITDDAKLTYGSMRGNFGLIGEFPAPGGNIYIAEGIATALSIFAALGGVGCVLIADNAGNLKHVGRAIRLKHPKANLIFCADNDRFDKHGKPRDLNPGLEAAHRAALNSKHCLVVSPGDMPSGNSDFNDLHALHGLDAVREQLNNAGRPDPALAFAHDVREELEKPGVNERFLPELNLKPGINLVRSPIGTGKTHALKPHSENAESFLYISHLQSLANDASSRLNLDLYLEAMPENLPDYPHLSICLNSLYKLTSGNGAARRFQYVVIDEIEQLLQRLCTKIDNKPLIISTLVHLLRSADHVILLDAHLGQTTLEFLRDTVPELPIHWHRNKWEVGQGREIVLHDDAGTVMKGALDMLKQGGKAFVTCNSKKQARAVFDYLSQTGKAGLYISGDNTGDSAVREFFRDVNGQATKYDFIVVTPAANTGISIDTIDGMYTAFDFVGGVFKTGINSPGDALQALGRVRGAQVLDVFIERKRGPVARSREEIKAAWLTAGREAQQLGILPVLDDTGRRMIADDVYTSIALAVTERRDQGQYNFAADFMRLAAIDGYSFSWQDDVAKTGKDIRKAAKEVEAAEYFERITDATEIDDGEAAELDHKNRKTLGETDSLERHKLEKFYGDSLPLAEALDFDRRGSGRAEIGRLELALMNDAELEKKHFDQAHELSADKRPYLVQAEFFRLLLGAVGIGTDLQNDNAIYTAGDMEGFVETVINDRNRFQAAARIPTASTLRKNPLKFIGEQLRRLGLKQCRTGRNGNGQYCIDFERLELVRGIVAGRQTALGTDHVFIYKTPDVSSDEEGTICLTL